MPSSVATASDGSRSRCAASQRPPHTRAGPREPRTRVRRRRVEQHPAPLHESTRSASGERPATRCSESTTAAPSPVTAEERAPRRRGRAATSARRGAGAAAERERRREADALQLAARELVVRRSRELRGADAAERLARRAARSAPARRRRSRARTRPRSDGPITTWSSGSWKTDATAPGELGGPCVRVSSPADLTRPAKRPPWKCGTSPASARSSVDLPEPDGPSSATSSPALQLERDVVAARHRAARVGERQARSSGR